MPRAAAQEALAVGPKAAKVGVARDDVGKLAGSSQPLSRRNNLLNEAQLVCAAHIDAARAAMGKEGYLYRKVAKTTRKIGEITRVEEYDRTFVIHLSRVEEMRGVAEEGHAFQVTARGREFTRETGPHGSNFKSTGMPAYHRGLVH